MSEKSIFDDEGFPTLNDTAEHIEPVRITPTQARAILEKGLKITTNALSRYVDLGFGHTGDASLFKDYILIQNARLEEIGLPVDYIYEPDGNNRRYTSYGAMRYTDYNSVLPLKMIEEIADTKYENIQDLKRNAKDGKPRAR